MSRVVNTIEIGLNAAIVAMTGHDPVILRIGGFDPDHADALPYGHFDPGQHRTMEAGLRELVERQTGIRPGYVEQLYTFGDRGRNRSPTDEGPHVVSVGYLALTRINDDGATGKVQKSGWRNWYEFLPWEDWRQGRPAILDEVIIPNLLGWAKKLSGTKHPVRGLDPLDRVRIAFGLEGSNWDDELVLDRYELMYSAALVMEAVQDGRKEDTATPVLLGAPMLHDHRRILATAISRLRGKLKYRPVVFELLPDSFTLTSLQHTVEGIFGRPVHKQNFRRLVENADLVEPTGASQQSTGGRPAALFRFRSDILKERPAPGLKIGR